MTTFEIYASKIVQKYMMENNPMTAEGVLSFLESRSCDISLDTTNIDVVLAYNKLIEGKPNTDFNG